MMTQTRTGVMTRKLTGDIKHDCCCLLIKIYKYTRLTPVVSCISSIFLNSGYFLFKIYKNTRLTPVVLAAYLLILAAAV